LAYAKLIMNPIADAGRRAKKWSQIMGLLKSIGRYFEHDLTGVSGHAIELAKSVARKSYELVASVGGDGTLNETGAFMQTPRKTHKDNRR